MRLGIGKVRVGLKTKLRGSLTGMSELINAICHVCEKEGDVRKEYADQPDLICHDCVYRRVEDAYDLAALGEYIKECKSK